MMYNNPDYPVMPWSECKMHFEHINRLKKENLRNPHIKNIITAFSELGKLATVYDIRSWILSFKDTFVHPKFINAYLQNNITISGVRRMICDGSLRIPILMIKRFYNGKIPVDELLSTSNDALVHAATTFDVTMGYKWTTYLYNCIIGRLKTLSQNHSSRFSHHTNECMRLIERARGVLGSGASPDEIRNWIINRGGLISINTIIQCELVTGGERVPIMRQPSRDYSNMIDDRIDGGALWKLAKEWLTDRSYNILQLRYGFDDTGENTLAEIANKVGCTRERVRQIENTCLFILQQIATTGQPPHINGRQLYIKPDKMKLVQETTPNNNHRRKINYTKTRQLRYLHERISQSQIH